MSPATSQKPSNRDKKSQTKRKSIRQREQEAREIVEEMHEEEPFNFDKTDLLAMIIAGYQVIMPFVIAGAGVMLLTYLLFWIWLR